jgi:cytochrome c oxidase cbb3-type subunit 4
MYRAFYEAGGLLHLPILALLLFLWVFVGVVAWVYVVRRRDPRFDELSLLPLRDDAPAPDGDGARHE